MSLPESLEHFQENIAIANRIRAAINLDPYGRAAEENERFARFKNTSGPSDIFCVGEIINDEGRDEHGEADIRFAPKWLRTPFCFLTRVSRDPERRIASPYGTVPAAYFAADGKPYMLQNIYYFSEFGQGIKYIDIFCPYDEDKTNEENFESYFGNSAPDMPTLAVTCSELDSGTAPLELGDYEMIGMALQSIESGIYVPSYRELF